VRLKSAPQEVDGLVQRVKGRRRIILGPHRLKNLIARNSHSWLRDKEGEQSKDLPSDCASSNLLSVDDDS
jgi:hypothetical protein